jgi:hypothetical protein
MKMTMILRACLWCFAVVLLLFLTACYTTQPERAASHRLAAVMANQGYSAFEPFRTDDYPPSIFVFARDYNGRKTDFLLGYWKDSFRAEPDELFKRQDVKTENKITGTNSMDIDLSISFLSPALTGSTTAKSIRSSTISFGDKQEIARMDIAKLSELRDRFNDNTLAALRFYKQRQQLSSCYIIMEVLIVNNFNMQLTMNDQASASLAVEKIKQLGDASLKASLTAAGTVTVEATGQYMVGFKALKVDDTILSQVVSKPNVSANYLTPEEVQDIRK